MKINHKIISIPPYLSSSWTQVRSLHMKDAVLVVQMVDGRSVEVPELSAETIRLIFSAHAAHVENHEQEHSPGSVLTANKEIHAQSEGQQNSLFDSSLRFGFTGLDELGNVLQHNPAQSDAPEIPEEILHKIAMITKIMAPGDLAMMPKPELHCNCIHCQISRAVLKGTDHEVSLPNHIEHEEDIVTDEDLRFQEWQITQTGPSLFTVANPLDTKERYSVYLGHPVGCTCGREGCEHIVAVLKS